MKTEWKDKLIEFALHSKCPHMCVIIIDPVVRKTGFKPHQYGEFVACCKCDQIQYTGCVTHKEK